MRLGYAPLCHQKVERSLFIGDYTQAVCARCSGLYIGGVAGLFAGAALLLTRRLRPRPSWLAWAVAPTGIDVLFGVLGLPALPNVPRLLLALPVGVMAALFLAVAVADLFLSRKHSRARHRLAPPVVEEPHG